MNTHSSASRPNPDDLLAAIQAQEASEHPSRGKLKLFFGMSPGVGKTYAMLQEAYARLAEGAYVLVGYVETHGRAETEALVRGLEVLPRKQLSYRGTIMEEFDLDAALARKPALILVDELAHTNAASDDAPPRHEKRWQDVLEILEAGIDVYSTLNVQHLESRADTVRSITGITIRETVPDSVLERADEIELIDISPEELLDRLEEGKVYAPERSEEARRNFFRKGNLTALREMALRLTADRVEGQLNEYRRAHFIAESWKSGDRLLVAVSGSPYSEQLVRWTRRMAYTMKSSWIALNVETLQPQSPENTARLAKNLALARELGADIHTIADDDVVRGIIRAARQHNISQIVVGKPTHQSSATIVERLIESSGTIDVHVVRVEDLPEQRFTRTKRLTRWTRLQSFFREVLSTSSKRWQTYALAVGMAAVLALVCLPLLPFISYQSIGLIMLFGVALSALFLSGSGIILMSALSAVLWNFLFIPPRFTFVIGSVEDRLMFLLYFVIALALGILTSRIRLRERAVRSREERTAALYDLARELSVARTVDEVVACSVKHIGALFDADVAVLLSEHIGGSATGADERLHTEVHPTSTFTPDAKERGTAEWVFRNNRSAGRFTATLPAVRGHYAPLLAPRGAVGVLGILIQGDNIRSDWRHLVEHLAGQIASALEREQLGKESEQSRLQAEITAQSERLTTTLLNSISHEFRTPLAVMSASAESLLVQPTLLQPSTLQPVQAEYAREIYNASRRLNTLVENLLDMTRLEAGHLRLRKQWCNLTETFQTALFRTRTECAQHVVHLETASDVMLCYCDTALIEQSLVNILLNAARHTPPGTQIQCALRHTTDGFSLTITDNGQGVPPESLPHLFDKFFRADGAKAGGTGLGLPIVKGFVEAHGGSIVAENRANGGLQFTILLPRGAEVPNEPLEERAETI
ncbi:MAG: sensor histidine kinase KdpD [Candidatus Kapabacteria bacterium]|jgi:two-component system sensor histidine kinase KdpD|nr:sensor histidine kinase KdpD [Candidatus Kapabacteria bacterium]